MQDDSAILSAIARGDKHEALRMMMLQHGNAVYNSSHEWVRDSILAEDVCQQVFFETYRKLSKFDGRRPVRAWLLAMTLRRSLDALKSEARYRRRHETQRKMDRAVPASALPADECLDIARMHRALAECINKLSPSARNAIVLRYLQGLSYEEMAPVLGDKPATLQMRVARALPALRACLAARLGVHSGQPAEANGASP